MGVQRATEVLHDVLAADVVAVALADADEPGDDRQDDHQTDVQVQVRVVAADDDLVQEKAQKQRIDESDEAGRDDRRQDDDDLEPVRLEEDEDLADRLSATLLGDRGRLTRKAAATHPAAAATGRAAGRRSCLPARKPHRPTLPRNARDPSLTLARCLISGGPSGHSGVMPVDGISYG